MTAREYDLIVLGGGTGRDVALAAEASGLNIAFIEMDKQARRHVPQPRLHAHQDVDP